MTGPPTLPDGYERVRTTPTFDASTVPKGLLAAHTVADGVWGRLVVYEGRLTFVFDDEADAPISVAGGGHLAIPPTRPHHLELDGPVRFAVEFYRRPEG